MKIREFVKQVCESKHIAVNVELCVCCMVDPAMDVDHEVTQEEMDTIEVFIYKFCDGLTNLVRNAAPTAQSILRQRVDYLTSFESVNDASKWLWQMLEKE